MSPRTGRPSPDSCKPWCSPATHKMCGGKCSEHLHRRPQTTNQPTTGKAGR
jgi:hypothetical protein